MLYIDSRASRAWRMLELRSLPMRSDSANTGSSVDGSSAKPRIQQDKHAAKKGSTSHGSQTLQRGLAQQQSKQGDATPAAVPAHAGTASSSRRLRDRLQHAAQAGLRALGGFGDTAARYGGAVVPPEGAVAVDLQGARFVFLRPVHAGV